MKLEVHINMAMAQKVKEIIANELGIDANTIADDAKIVADLGADSLAVMQIVMAVEDEFGVSVPETDIMKMETVNNIVDYINAQK